MAGCRRERQPIDIQQCGPKSLCKKNQVGFTLDLKEGDERFKEITRLVYDLDNDTSRRLGVDAFELLVVPKQKNKIEGGRFI